MASNSTVTLKQTSDGGFIITQMLTSQTPFTQPIEQVALDFPTAISKLAAIFGVTLTIAVAQEAQPAQPVILSATATQTPAT
jgi:hypothetical protein